MTTFARLSLWLPEGRETEFEKLFATQCRPLLEKHGLTHSEPIPPGDRAGADGLSHHFFEVESPSQVAILADALSHEPDWPEPLPLRNGWTAEETGSGYYFGLFSTPAHPGRRVDAGLGTRRKDWHGFSLRDGLPSPHVMALLQDRHGGIWVGTQNGLCRYDGSQFECFTVADGLAGNHTSCLMEDGRSRIWVGTGDWSGQNGRGVSCYDGQSWQTFTQADGLGANVVRTLLEDRQGDLWLGTRGGLSHYDGQRFTTYTMEDGLPASSVSRLLQDRHGQLWIGTNEGVCCFDGQVFTTYTPEHGLEGPKVHSLYEDSDGQLWVATTIGWSRFHPETQTFITQMNVADRAYAVVEDGDGQLWFPISPNGIARYDGRQFSYLTTADGLPSMGVITLICDREERIWIGTQGSGLAYMDPYGCVTYTRQEGLASDAITTVWEDRQARLWLGTHQAVTCYDGQTFIPYQVDKDENVWGNAAYAFYEDRQGQLWMANYKGDIKRFDGEEWTDILVGDWRFGQNYARSLVEGDDGSVWIANGGSCVYRYDGREFRAYTAADGLVADAVRCILKDRHGQLWFATEGGGLSRYDGRQFVTVSDGAALGYYPPLALLEDRHGRLWIATNGGGVYCYDGEQFRQYTTHDGLVYDQVMCLCEDQQGHLWMGTLGGGVSRYDGRVFQTLSSADGLYGDQINAVVEDRHGNVWLATHHGLTRYRSRATPPSVRLREVMADRRYTAEESIAVPESQPWVRVAFQGQSFTTRPEGMVYVYRLEGVDEDWQVTREETVTYRSLPQGQYTFQVQTVDRDLNYSEPAAVEIEVTPDLRLQALQEALNQSGVAGEFVGNSPALSKVQVELMKVAGSDLTVLILGETGTGKGLAARTVHGMSDRKEDPFIQVNCGAITQNLVESELFGHERGAFTGAVSRKLGKVELAAGGTLFLDEIGDMALEAQIRLLRLLEEGTFERVGGTETLPSEVRVIAATNRDLGKMVGEGSFREDLFFRLQVFPVRLPSLRQRREDIPLLVDYFMVSMAAHLHKTVTGVTSEALTLLKSYDWPGNVRELKHTVDRGVVVCRGETIQAEDMAVEAWKTEKKVGNGRVSLEENERNYIRQVLEETGWVIKGAQGAATLLGLHPSTLNHRIRKLGLGRP